MKKYVILFLAVIYSLSISGQTTNGKGIQFFKGSWDELLKVARQQDKMIFIDVYTDWCTPCKYMDKYIFTEQKVGRKYNSLFLNYKINAEKGEGRYVAQKYSVGAYPGFLFLNSSGSLVHKTTGERELEPFISLAEDAVMHSKDKNNPGNLEKEFRENNRDPLFLRRYINRLAELNMDNSEVLDEYFKTISYQQLEEDSTLLYLAQHVVGTRTAALGYLINNYDKLSKASKAKVTRRLFDKLVRYAAGLALQEKRLMEYTGLRAFASRLDGLNERDLLFLARLDLMHDVLIRDYPQVQKAGYALANELISIPIDSIRAEDKRRYEKIAEPFLQNKMDSIKVAQFEEEKKYLVNIYSRDIGEQLYFVAQNFAQLPPSEKLPLADAIAWAKRAHELLPEGEAISDLIKDLEEKIR